MGLVSSFFHELLLVISETSVWISEIILIVIEIIGIAFVIIFITFCGFILYCISFVLVNLVCFTARILLLLKKGIILLKTCFLTAYPLFREYAFNLKQRVGDKYSNTLLQYSSDNNLESVISHLLEEILDQVDIIVNSEMMDHTKNCNFYATVKNLSDKESLRGCIRSISKRSHALFEEEMENIEFTLIFVDEFSTRSMSFSKEILLESVEGAFTTEDEIPSESAEVILKELTAYYRRNT